MNRNDNLKDALSKVWDRPVEVSPVITGTIASALTAKDRGSTVFNTGRVMSVGTSSAPAGFAIGGEPDTQGKQIASTSRTDAHLPTVIGEMQRVRRQTGNNPTKGMGTWKTSEAHNAPIDYDAVGIHDVPRQEALGIAKSRGEIAVFEPRTGDAPGVAYGKGEESRKAYRRRALGGEKK